MDYKIIWSDKSIEDFEKIINYLSEEWSGEIANGFITAIGKRLEILKAHPMHGIATVKNVRFRKIVLTKQNSLYYEIKQNNILILRIFDNRQHPRRLKLGKR